MEVIVDVPDWRIRSGKRQSAFGCPVGRAVKAALPYGERAAVGLREVHVLAVAAGVLPGDPANVSVPLPPAAVEWLRRWDAGEDPPPFRFVLTFPDPVSARKGG